MHTRYYTQARSPHRRWAPRLIFIVVGLGLFSILGLSLLRHPAQSLPQIGDPVPAVVLHNLTTIPSATWYALGTQGATPAFQVTPRGRPMLFYAGAEGCPFCAAERWVIVVTLARFGNFTGLTLMQSNSTDTDPNTPTMSFLHARYHSPYLTAQLMELDGRQIAPNGQGFYPPLRRLSPVQTTWLTQYDNPPYLPTGYSHSIPFVLVGHRYLWIGSAYNPALLAGHTWLTISQAIRSGHGPIAHAVLVNANALTAAICAVDGRRPISTCRAVGSSVPLRPTPKMAS